MGRILDRVEACVRAIRARSDLVPEAAVVLGSGLGGFAEQLRPVAAIDYREIPGFPVSTVEGHAGRFLLGSLGGKQIAVMQGRVHYYEGYAMEDVVLPIRVLGRLGAKQVILTNAAGGIGPGLAPGDLMLLTDHIASFVPSPLIGPNEDALGTRFPDMTAVYSPLLREKAKAAAKGLGITLKEGVYLQTTGPAYETPAEVRMFARLGADAVGMSTACEAVAARHSGMEVCGISCITNLAAGLGDSPLSHGEVQTAADRAARDFTRLLLALIAAL